MKSAILAVALLASPVAMGAYVVTGEPEAFVCGGIGIKKCSHKPVAAVKQNGQLYEFSREFDRVSEYSTSKGRCWMRTGGSDLLAWAARKATNAPIFMTRENGQLVELDNPDYVTFKCRKR